MATYMVYVPMDIGDPVRRADRTIFVRDGFSRAAFVFGPLYLLYRRLWLAAIGWLVVATALAFGVHALNLAPGAVAALFGLLALLTGYEAGTMRQAGLRRRGYAFAALLAGLPRPQAERAFFAGEGADPLSSRRAAAIGSPDAVEPPAIIGSFPNPRDP